MFFHPQIVARVLQPQGVTIAVVNIAESMSLAQSVGKLTVIPLNNAKNWLKARFRFDIFIMINYDSVDR